MNTDGVRKLLSRSFRCTCWSRMEHNNSYNWHLGLCSRLGSTSPIHGVVCFSPSSPKAPTVGARSSITKAQNRTTIPALFLNQNERIHTKSGRHLYELLCSIP